MNDPILNANALTSQKVGSAQASENPGHIKAKEAAEEFEAIFLSQMLATMTEELGGAGSVAGDNDVYRDMFTKEVSKMISRSGGIGVADTILQEMLKAQEIG